MQCTCHTDQRERVGFVEDSSVSNGTYSGIPSLVCALRRRVWRQSLRASTRAGPISSSRHPCIDNHTYPAFAVFHWRIKDARASLCTACSLVWRQDSAYIYGPEGREAVVCASGHCEVHVRRTFYSYSRFLFKYRRNSSDNALKMNSKLLLSVIVNPSQNLEPRRIDIDVLSQIHTDQNQEQRFIPQYDLVKRD